MPELPEVETVRRTLLPRLVGRRVRSVDVRRPGVCLCGVSGREANARALLLGAVIDRVERLGKQLAIVARDGRVLRAHLGMTGRLTLRDQDAPVAVDAHARHRHAVWRLDGAELAFEDPRRFGGVWAYESIDSLRRHAWSRLGPDALSISAQDLTRALHGGRLAIKAALLDQGRLAGVGNIYADESLFDARVHPTIAAGTLHNQTVTRLAAAIRRILERAVEAGGTTLRDYRDAEGSPGRGRRLCKVYGRGGMACRRCGRVLHEGAVAQRTTVWCPDCQPRHASEV